MGRKRERGERGEREKGHKGRDERKEEERRRKREGGREKGIVKQLAKAMKQLTTQTEAITNAAIQSICLNAPRSFAVNAP